jgi:hypothetical protein
VPLPRGTDWLPFRFGCKSTTLDWRTTLAVSTWNAPPYQAVVAAEPPEPPSLDIAPDEPVLPDEAASLTAPELPIPLSIAALEDASERPADPASNDAPPPPDDAAPASAVFAERAGVPQPGATQRLASVSASPPNAAILECKAAPYWRIGPSLQALTTRGRSAARRSDGTVTLSIETAHGLRGRPETRKKHSACLKLATYAFRVARSRPMKG